MRGYNVNSVLTTHFPVNPKLIKKNKVYQKDRGRENSNYVIILPLYWLNSIIEINKVFPLSSATNLNSFRNYATIDMF